MDAERPVGREDGRADGHGSGTGAGRAGRACACETCHGMGASHPPHAHPHFCARRRAILAQRFQWQRARARIRSPRRRALPARCVRAAARRMPGLVHAYAHVDCTRERELPLHRRAKGGTGGSGVDGERASPAESIPAQGRGRGERERQRQRERAYPPAESIPAQGRERGERRTEREREHTRPPRAYPPSEE